MIFKNFLIIFLSFISFNLFANNLDIKGLSKLTLDDLQTQTSIDLYKSFYTEDDINLLIKELYTSELIFDIKYNNENNKFNLIIEENKLVENIFINGNTRIDDDLIINNIVTKISKFISKESIKEDIKIIKSIYLMKGFNYVNITASTEKYSEDRINLIFEITENQQSQIDRIKFKGNDTFSDRYLLSLINSKASNFYNIFSAGSNLNLTNFDFDVNKIKTFYKQKGFFDVDVNFSINETISNKYTLIFYVLEGERLVIDDFEIDNSDSNLSKLISNDFENLKNEFSKNNFFYDQFIVDDFLSKINKVLIENNQFNISFNANLAINNEFKKLIFKQNLIKPSTVNKINIIGNEITKDKTIRSKLSFEPGDYFNSNSIDTSKKNLLKFKYINEVDIKTEKINETSDVTVIINENKKTGQFLAGGTFSGDIGAGATLAINDNNIFGTGNIVDAKISVNQENVLFNTTYTQFPTSTSNIMNKYSIFNLETDLSKSFGFKKDEYGFRYSINFEHNEMFDIKSGVSYKKSERHSPKKSIDSISDNIGDYDIYTLNLSLLQNNTNDFLYPTNGLSNSLHFEYSPKDISDDSFYKIILKSDIYRQFKNSNRFLFFSNDFGLADSLEGKLSTVNAFSLGGLNFKGFDYRGVGPKQNNIYLGGNKFFTSTIGYGGSFLFDDNDNINTKIFYSMGSIWDSDYSNDNEFDTRSSLGVSFDVLTAVGPISLSYAVPIEKNNKDVTNEFNFSIGTSF